MLSGHGKANVAGIADQRAADNNEPLVVELLKQAVNIGALPERQLFFEPLAVNKQPVLTLTWADFQQGLPVGEQLV